MSSSSRHATCTHCRNGVKYIKSLIHGEITQIEVKCYHCSGSGFDPDWLVKECDKCSREIFYRESNFYVPAYCRECKAKIKTGKR